MRLSGLLLVLALSSTACSYRARQRPLSAADVPDGSRMTNYLSAPLRPGSPSEEAPSGLSREIVVDEAWVTRLEPTEVCVHLLSRHNVTIDMPMSDWNLALNGTRVYVDAEEAPQVYDYDVTGERVVVDLAAVGLGALQVTQPEAQVFRVVERKASICGPGADRGVVRLEVELPQDDRRGSYGEVFEWLLR